jgi:hypothetical protein
MPVCSRERAQRAQRLAGSSGRDPALGPVTIVGGRDGINGARSAPDAPGIQLLLDSLGAPGGVPALEGVW